MSSGKRHNLQGQVVGLEAKNIYLENEIERLNNIINEKNKEIEDYSNKWCELAKAKTKSDNIINGIEKYCNDEINEGNKILEKLSNLYNSSDTESFIKGQQAKCKHILDKLQELKGSDK